MYKRLEQDNTSYEARGWSSSGGSGYSEMRQKDRLEAKLGNIHRVWWWFGCLHLQDNNRSNKGQKI